MTEHPPPATPDDDPHLTPPEELAQPVPITVWHVPGPPPGAVASAQLVRRLVVNYSPPRSAVLDLLPGTRLPQNPGGDPVTLVITSWPRPGASAEEHLDSCARRLRPGGCLTVVVANADIPDQLGRLVTAARAAGLTYLQHVVAAHHLAPRTTEPVTDCGDRPHTARGARAERALRVHTDVLVFRLPALGDD